MRISKAILTLAITVLSANAFAGSVNNVKCPHMNSKISLFSNTNLTQAQQAKIDAKSVKGQR